MRIKLFHLLATSIVSMLSLPACLPANAGNYGRDANPIVCRQLTSDIEQQEAELNEVRRNFRLLEAAGKGCIDVAKDLLANGAAIDSRDRFANTALHHAAEGGHAGMIRLLLDQGANVNQPNGTWPCFRIWLNFKGTLPPCCPLCAAMSPPVTESFGVSTKST